MQIALIAGIILFGLLLVVVEFYLIPGTTFFGILGGIVMCVGIYLAYTEVGFMFGNITLGTSAILGSLLFYYGFKYVQSESVAIHETIDGKVNVLEEGLVQVGDEGKTINVLRPNGKALINDHKIEVYSRGGDYIDSGEPIKVVKIESNKIFVKSTKV